jgi:hypothetical protein
VLIFKIVCNKHSRHTSCRGAAHCSSKRIRWLNTSSTSLATNLSHFSSTHLSITCFVLYPILSSYYSVGYMRSEVLMPMRSRLWRPVVLQVATNVSHLQHHTASQYLPVLHISFSVLYRGFSCNFAGVLRAPKEKQTNLVSSRVSPCFTSIVLLGLPQVSARWVTSCAAGMHF